MKWLCDAGARLGTIKGQSDLIKMPPRCPLYINPISSGTVIFSLKKLFICVILMLYAKIVKTKPDINLTLTRVETSKGRPGPEKWCCFLGARADIWAFTLSYFDRKSSILVLLHQICIISFAMRPIFRAPYTVQARARPICFNLF